MLHMPKSNLYSHLVGKGDRDIVLLTGNYVCWFNNVVRRKVSIYNVLYTIYVGFVIA